MGKRGQCRAIEDTAYECGMMPMGANEIIAATYGPLSVYLS